MAVGVRTRALILVLVCQVFGCSMSPQPEPPGATKHDNAYDASAQSPNTGAGDAGLVIISDASGAGPASPPASVDAEVGNRDGDASDDGATSDGSSDSASLDAGSPDGAPDAAGAD